MAKRRYEVALSTVVTIEFDDEAVSEWDGSTFLTAHENPERFLEGSTPDDVIGALAITVGPEGRSVGRTDGWADWPEGSAYSVGWCHYEVDGILERSVTP